MNDFREPDTATSRIDPGRAERYIAELFAVEDSHLRGIRAAMEEEGFPTIQVPAATGRLLQVLVRAVQARRVLEVGTLGGYSALWMARALAADGTLISLERDPARAVVARAALAGAGLSERVDVRVGEAKVLLSGIGPDASFDVIFLDADKQGLAVYLDEAARLLRPGGLLLTDNALWRGTVMDPEERDPDVEAIRNFTRRVAGEPGWDGTIVPVGDGVLMAVRREG